VTIVTSGIVACGQSSTMGTDTGVPVADTSVSMDASGLQCMDSTECPSGEVCSMTTGRCVPQTSVDPCANSMDCESCTAQLGCGFCGATGRCLSGSSTGPASGACAAGWAWNSSMCSSAPPPDGGCVRTCGSRRCGSDGCGGVCGTCAAGETCNRLGQCEAPPVNYGARCDQCDELWATTRNCAVGGTNDIRATCGSEGWCRRGPTDAAGYCTGPCRTGMCPSGFTCRDVMVGQNFCVR
jgi:hypothetical protein